MIFILGGSGLVGSAFVRYCKKRKLKYVNLTRDNKKKYHNKKCEIFIDCNGNGSKRLGIQNPYYDFQASVSTVVDNLFNYKYNKYIYISSSQVYENTSLLKCTKEEKSKLNLNLNSYGFNKLVSENFIIKHAKKHLIFRLPYVVGPGLKRNPVFDLSNSKKTYLSLDSLINCVHTDTIANIVFQIINKKIKNQVYNLGSSNNIKIRQILNLCEINKNELVSTKKTSDKMFFNCKKISKIITLPTSKNEILKYLEGKN